MDFDRLKLLEQQMAVMQKEVSEVLNEMQTTMLLTTKTYSTALKILMERVDVLEKKNGTETNPTREDSEGKEI